MQQLHEPKQVETKWVLDTCFATRANNQCLNKIKNCSPKNYDGSITTNVSQQLWCRNHEPSRQRDISSTMNYRKAYKLLPFPETGSQKQPTRLHWIGSFTRNHWRHSFQHPYKQKIQFSLLQNTTITQLQHCALFNKSISTYTKPATSTYPWHQCKPTIFMCQGAEHSTNASLLPYKHLIYN